LTSIFPSQRFFIFICFSIVAALIKSTLNEYRVNFFQENPSDKDLNQGTLVIFNLDPSVSNEEVRQIFGAYGEVKEVRMLLLVFDSLVISFYLLATVMLIVLVSICR
jgi:hypothetical protein